ncbi:MAG: NTP pyrophosphatase (non-canonical NTP hydrolase) [Bradymonadia bacterium]|jgi:NTP pyrophosphatase (non-canonical NTP hydrolase)
MDFATYQSLAERTARTDRETSLRMSNAALGLAGEAGEAVEIVKKHLHHGHDLDRARLQKEVGDVLWYVAELCSVAGIALDDAASGNIEKLRARYPEGFEEARSQTRAPGDD